jgi:hypothetical protein
MSKRLSMIALMGMVGFAAACGPDHATPAAGGTGGTPGTGGTNGNGDAGPTAPAPACLTGANEECLPSGFPFSQVAFAHSYACNGVCPAASPAGTTILFSQPASGTLCLSGTNPDPLGTDLTLVFTEGTTDPRTGTDTVTRRFNADDLHITQVKFTIDRPPSDGVTVSATTLHGDVCHELDCITFGFTLPGRITASGTTTARLVDFVSSPPKTFDTRALNWIDFAVGPGAFDFCVRDFQFLDASGAVVTP